MSAIVYVGRISRHLEGEYHRRFRKWKFELCNYRRVFIRFEARIWWRR